MTDKKPIVKQEEEKGVRHVAVEALVEGARSSRSTGLARIVKDRFHYLAAGVDSMSRSDVVRGYVVLNRVKNALDRRLKQLRGAVDAAIAAEGMGPNDKELRLEAGEIAVVAENRAYQKKTLNRDKLFEVMDKKKIDRGHAFVTPPPPAPVFSEEKAKAMVTLGIITEAEWNACMEDCPASLYVSTDLPDAIDEQMLQALFGEEGEPKKKLKK